MRDRKSMKGRRTTRGFSMLIHDYFRSPQYAALSARAVKALIDLYTQFRGNNNGDLCATWSIMRTLGWTSKDQLGKAIAELEECGWIIRTRQGPASRALNGRKPPTLYAVTFLGIDHCGGKLDVQPNPAPSHLWKTMCPPRPTGHVDPPHGAKDEGKQAYCPAPRANEHPIPTPLCPATRGAS